MQASWFLLVLVFASSLSLFFWGLRYKERICQYPFFMGFAFVSFILPQAVVVQSTPFPASVEGVNRVFVMAFLSALMCWIGYRIKLPATILKNINRSTDSSIIRIGGFLYSCIGLGLWLLIYSLPESRGVGQYWTGVITIYAFFANLLNVGFVILLIDIFKKPAIYKFLLILPSASTLLYRCVIAGRRTSIMFVVFGILCALFFVRRKAPSRSLVLIGALLAVLTLASVHEYRVISKSGNWSEVSKINPVENLKALAEENDAKSLELRNAAAFIDNTVQMGDHQWGTGYWDRLVFRWVPAQLLGKEFKDSLTIGKDLNARYETIYETYGYKHQKGTTVTGLGDSFLELDYFGCLLFAALALFFKCFWLRAVAGDLFSQTLYILMVPSAFTFLTHGTTEFLPILIFYLIFLSILFKGFQLLDGSSYKKSRRFY